MWQEASNIQHLVKLYHRYVELIFSPFFTHSKHLKKGNNQRQDGTECCWKYFLKSVMNKNQIRGTVVPRSIGVHLSQIFFWTLNFILDPDWLLILSICLLQRDVARSVCWVFNLFRSLFSFSKPGQIYSVKVWVLRKVWKRLSIRETSERFYCLETSRMLLYGVRLSQVIYGMYPPINAQLVWHQCGNFWKDFRPHIDQATSQKLWMLMVLH